MNEYEQQAQNFLEATDTTLSIDYNYYGVKCDVYEFTLTTPLGTYSGTFRQSIVNTKAGKKPTPYDILACLDPLYVDSFEKFCSKFDYYDEPITEYPRVKSIYDACVAQDIGLREIYTREQLKLLQEIN